MEKLELLSALMKGASLKGLTLGSVVTPVRAVSEN